MQIDNKSEKLFHYETLSHLIIDQNEYARVDEIAY